MIALSKILVKPTHPDHLPNSAKWLAGEGAGSWFVIENMYLDSKYKISRFSPIGDLECIGHYVLEYEIDLTKEYSITYPSHCSIVSIVQGQITYFFKSLQ